MNRSSKTCFVKFAEVEIFKCLHLLEDSALQCSRDDQCSVYIQGVLGM